MKESNGREKPSQNEMYKLKNKDKSE